MKYVVFSDLHGNDFAFKAMLIQLNNTKVDGYIFCGDIVGYYYDARKIIKRFKKLDNLIIVRGNHDDQFCNSYYNHEDRLQLSKKYGSSYLEENENLFYYLQDLPYEVNTKIGDKSVHILHGSIEDKMNGRIYPDSLYDLGSQKADIVFAGHTHYRMFKDDGKRQFINPGSLGQPRDGKGFSYVVYDFDTGECIYNCVNYDLLELINQIDTNDGENEYLKTVLFRN